jgi:small subunit ribosomal protein S20
VAHSKSAIKRWRQSIEARDRNRAVKSHTRTLLAKAQASVDSDASTAEEAVRAAVSALDKAAQKGVIHANAAARGKARLLKRFNLATAGAVAAAASAEAKPAPKTASKKADAGPKKAAPKKTAKAADAKPAARGRTRKTT